MFVRKVPVQPAEGGGEHSQRDSDGAEIQMDPDLTQDSIINDSAFIPGTPPAKKVAAVQFLLCFVITPE